MASRHNRAYSTITKDFLISEKIEMLRASIDGEPGIVARCHMTSHGLQPTDHVLTMEAALKLAGKIAAKNAGKERDESTYLLGMAASLIRAANSLAKGQIPEGCAG